MTEPEIRELYCSDCGSQYYATDDYVSDRDIQHCLLCGGVNVDVLRLRFQEYLDREHPQVEVVDDYDMRRDEIWNVVKGINTDDELDEIWDLLYGR